MWWKSTRKAGVFFVAVRKEVVEEVENPMTQLSLTQAAKYQSGAVVGSIVEIPLETKEFGRIAAQAAKHVIRQGIREAERGQLLLEYQSRQYDIITATVLKLDQKKGGVTVEIGRSEALLPKAEQVPGEVYKEGERIKVYVSDVGNGEKGPWLMISRTHPGSCQAAF